MGCSYHDIYQQGQPRMWDPSRNESLQEQERIARTLSAVPEDAYSILEVGCGNGATINRLAGRRRIVGVDVSMTALRWVTVPRGVASAARLPFANQAFDLVMALEVLEHLPQGLFHDALTELARVSSKYILVSVPNEEPVDLATGQCPFCGCIYHPYRHLRSFSPRRMLTLVPGYSPVFVEPIGPIQKSPRRLELFVRRRLFGVPPASAPTAICPQCGESPQTTPSETNLGELPKQDGSTPLRALLRVLKNILLPGKDMQPWLLALYTKQS